ISRTYKDSLHLLYQEDSDPLCLQYHTDCLRRCIFPLYMSLSLENLPQEWVLNCAHVLG
ncbi:hypothetical protein K439DRAFT_1370820, partial [Ramaria rubella]